MDITLNGENYPLDNSQTVQDLVIQLNLQGKRIAIEVNHAIVPRTRHSEFVLQHGDQVEIVHAIGGG